MSPELIKEIVLSNDSHIHKIFSEADSFSAEIFEEIKEEGAPREKVSEEIKECEEDNSENNVPDPKITLPPSCKQSIGRLFGSKADFKDVRDDPKCPNLFQIKELKAMTDENDSTLQMETKLLSSNLILEIVHLLFCRQWKFVAFSHLPALSQSLQSTPKDAE